MFRCCVAVATTHQAGVVFPGFVLGTSAHLTGTGPPYAISIKACVMVFHDPHLRSMNHDSKYRESHLKMQSGAAV